MKDELTPEKSSSMPPQHHIRKNSEDILNTHNKQKKISRQVILSLEYDFHRQMLGRKIRVPELIDKRNQLSYTSLGDKPYKEVERSDQFFKDGGLLPGSSIVPRSSHQKRYGLSDLESVVSYDSTNPKRTKWKDKAKKDQLSEEISAVEALRDWEKATFNK